MKVLNFITPTGLFGAERWVLAQVNNYKKGDLDYCDLVITQEHTQNNLEIINLYPKSIGQTHIIKTKGPFDLAAIKGLNKVIKSRGIDIIHTHGYKSDIIGFIAAKMTGIKCISTPHGFGSDIGFKLKAYIKLGLFFLRFYDAIAPLSIQLVEEIKSAGIKDSKITYIQNGVDLLEIDKHLSSKESSDKTVRIGYIGQLIPRKNISHIIDAIDRIYRSNKDIELLILGSGPEEDKLKQKAVDLGLENIIHFLGFRPDRLDYLNKFDIFVMTSSSEGIPRSMMEAMAMKVAVVSYNIDGVDQLIQHNKTGLLAPFGEIDQLTDQILNLINDQQLRMTLSVNARKHIENHFSARRMAFEYLDLYRAVLK